VNAAKTVVATAETDVTGFYYVARTGNLAPGSSYSAKVTRLPKPYKKAKPATKTFTWQGSPVDLGTFVLE
jgi:hypothetical protein